MSATLELDNFNSTSIQEKTYLDLDYATGTSLYIKSSQNITSDLYALVGTIGQEQTELALIDSVSGNVLTLHTALNNTHNIYEDVTILIANQMQIYRAADIDGSIPADSAFSALDIVNIDPDQLTTTYIDAGGSSNYWYKYTYLNESTSDETLLQDSVATLGGNVHYTSLDNIRQEAGFNANEFISDVLISDKRDVAENTINATLSSLYTVPFSPAPPTISYITELLAASYLLSTDYGPFASGTTKDGKTKFDEAMLLLDGLSTQTSSLIDPTGVVIPVSPRPTGWPLDSTATARPENNGGERLFRISDQY